MTKIDPKKVINKEPLLIRDGGTGVGLLIIALILTIAFLYFNFL